MHLCMIIKIMNIKKYFLQDQTYLAYNFYYVTKVKHTDVRTHCLCLEKKKKKTALAAVLEYLFSYISLALSRDMKRKL